MPEQPPRKRLTERVAERKAGIKEPEYTPRQEAICQRLELFGNVIAMFGLFMLAFTVFRSQGDVAWASDNTIMYAVVFVLGRAIKMSAKPFSKMF